MQTQSVVQNIVIVGGGAGGLELATRLGRKLKHCKTVSLTLIDASLTHIWKPLWHEVAAGTLNSHEDEVNYIAHAYQNHFNFILGKLDGLDRAKKEILLAPVYDENKVEAIPRRHIHYDTLIIAIGSVSNDFNTPGVRENCYFLDDRFQADHFQQQFLKKILQAQNQLQSQGFDKLTIAIVGGGATGVELAAELHYAIEQASRYSRSQLIASKDVKICVIEASERILAALPERISKSTTEELKKLGIEVYTGQRVAEVNEKGLLTTTGLFIAADLKVWAAGIKAPDILQHLDGLEASRINQLIVKQTLETTRDENIFAFGDCASCPQPTRDNQPVPPRAQAAHQQAKHLAKNIIRKLKGKPPLPFFYRDYGSLISLSHQTAIGNLMGRIKTNYFIEGKIARWMYISLYKKHQANLYGYWRTAMLTIANILTRRIKPRLKLH